MTMMDRPHETYMGLLELVQGGAPIHVTMQDPSTVLLEIRELGTWPPGILPRFCELLGGCRADESDLQDSFRLRLWWD